MKTDDFYKEFYEQWWWRRLAKICRDPSFKLTWKVGQRAAFLYEIELRIKATCPPQKPWPLLSHGQRLLLIKQWPLLTPDAQGTITFANPHHYKGWTPPMLISVNLQHSKTAILAEFENWLDGVLAKSNTATNRGRKLRPMSWRPIELIDIKNAHPDQILNESERSQVSKAKAQFDAVQ